MTQRQKLNLSKTIWHEQNKFRVWVSDHSKIKDGKNFAGKCIRFAFSSFLSSFFEDQLLCKLRNSFYGYKSWKKLQQIPKLGWIHPRMMFLRPNYDKTLHAAKTTWIWKVESLWMSKNSNCHHLWLCKNQVTNSRMQDPRFLRKVENMILLD